MADDGVVISGISGRFPESDNLEEFWNNLINGVDMITENDRRWPIGTYGLPTRKGTLKADLEKFDARFFNTSRKQAGRSDPQVAQLLEVSYEAVLDSGVNPTTIRGANVGVYCGCSSHEMIENWRSNPETISIYDVLGGSECMLANRISYCLDLKGPSFTIDTYCSSSMIALHNAASAIRNGEIEAAIVCGVNMLLDPVLCHQINSMGILSRDGKCKSFDASGDGYARSEAIVAVFLQKKSVARRNYGQIVHSKSSADGYKLNGVSHPSGAAQEKLMRDTYKEAGLDPNEVMYFEAHGTGTSIGDPEELNAVANIFARNRTSKSPLLIGSTKSNMGHSEGASSLCALSKLVLSIQQGLLPPNLHFSNPNPAVPALLNGNMKVVTQCTPIKGTLFSINSSGIGGTNAHVILKSEVERYTENYSLDLSLPVLIPFSGRTKEGVELGLERIVAAQNDTIGLLQEIHAHPIPGFDWRGFAVLDNITIYTGIQAQLIESTPRPLWYIFAGIGSQWTGMAKQMMAFPTFKKSIEESSEIMKEYQIDLMGILMSGNEELMNNYIGISFISFGMALIDLMSSIALEPDGMIGHSAGEILCAYAEGSLSKMESLLINMYKDECLKLKCFGGGMASVGLTWEEAMAQCPPGFYPACHNGSLNVSVSGPADKIKSYVNELNIKGVFAREIDTGGYGFHSPYIAPGIPLCYTNLQSLLTNPKKRSKKWISSSLPESRWNEPIVETSSADYFINNFANPVRFYDAQKHIPPNAVVVELSPHSMLLSILKKDLPKTCTLIGLMKRHTEDNPLRFVSAIGSLFQLGFDPKISGLYPEKVFPVKTGSAMIAPLVKWNHDDLFPLPDFNKKNSPGYFNQIVEISLGNEEDKFLEGHIIDNRILFPATGYLVLVWKALAKLNCTDYQKFPVHLKNVKFERATILFNAKTKVSLKINILEITGQFEISEGSSIIATGLIFKVERCSVQQLLTYETSIKEFKTTPSLLEHLDIYKWFRLRGYQYEGSFRGIFSAEMDGSLCKILWRDNWIAFLDAMLQTSLFSSNPMSMALPTRINMITIDPVAFSKFVDNNSLELQVSFSAMLNVISAPGVELQGLNFTESPRRTKIQPGPVLEEYKFVPYMDSKDVVWEYSTALKICLDIILENIKSKSLRICEYGLSGGQDSIGGLLKALNNHPGRKVNIQLISEAFLNLNPKSKNQDNTFDLLIVRENSNIVSKYEYLVQPDGFIILITTNPNPLELTRQMKNSSWNPVPVVYKRTQDHHLYIFRKNQLTSESDSYIEIDEGFKWINILKTELEEADKSSVLLRSNSSTCGILGLVNCLRAEPGGGNIRCISTPTSATTNIPDNNLVFNVFNEDGEVGCYRHVIIPDLENRLVRSGNVQLRQNVRGNLSTLHWTEIPFLEKHEDVYEIYYASLNFRDIMVATGQLSPEALPENTRKNDNVLGTEFAGLNTFGQRVMAIIPAKSFATQVKADKALVWPVPKSWTMEEAATVPVAYSTAYLALVVRGQIQPGESILIHSGAGAVGQAAIRIALSFHCKIFITVGSDIKKAYLMEKFPKLREKNFASSRNTDFREHILRETQGTGVNLVLNSLAHEKLQASLEVLACNGRFLEIGKLDMFRDSALRMSFFLKNIAFHGILLENLIFSNSSKDVERLVQDGIESGVVQPIDRTVYQYDQAEAAFRTMTTGTHIGKIILKIRDEKESSFPMASVIPVTYFNPEKLYIIVGGLGGIGLEMADWFITRGANKLAIVSRAGIVNGFQALKTNKWSRAGVRVLISRQDTSTLNGVKELFQECLKYGPIGGIFNLAMVLRDGIFQNQTVEDFQAVLKPKLNITANLDLVSRQLCRKNLDYFVVFSSVSCGRGNASQTNYGMANSSMERICENRRKDGFPAMAIQWGAIAEAGIVHELTKGKDTLVGGTVPQFLSSCFAVLDKFLYFQHYIQSPVVSSLVLPENMVDEFNEEVNEKVSICSALVHILGLQDTSKIPKKITLGELGVDSLISVEVQQLLEKHTSNNFTTNEIKLLTWEKLETMGLAFE